MISSRYRFLFIHIPKTGGNAVQSLLLPFSDDRMVLGETQDGKNRFNLRGPVTPHKHATLQEYHDTPGFRRDGLRLVAAVRPPFERMVSLYFSPHRWIGTSPQWDVQDFRAMLQQALPATAYLTVAGRLQRPDVLLRFERLAEDFAAMVDKLGLPAGMELPLRNQGAALELQNQILTDASLRAEVEDRFRSDMELA